MKIRTFQSILHNVNVQLQSVKKRLAVIQRSQSSAKNLDPLQQLVIVSQEDNAETRLGNLIAQQDSLQQQLAFSKEIESAKVVVAARPVKASAHSRNIVAARRRAHRADPRRGRRDRGGRARLRAPA